MLPLLYSDIEFVEMIRCNNRSGFEYLFNIYAPLLVRSITKQGVSVKGVNKIIEEVFCDVWANIHQYSAEKLPLYMWMHQKVLSMAKDYVQNEQQQVSVDVISYQ